MTRKTISVLMGAAMLVGSVAAASAAGNSVSIYTGPGAATFKNTGPISGPFPMPGIGYGAGAISPELWNKTVNTGPFYGKPGTVTVYNAPNARPFWYNWPRPAPRPIYVPIVAVEPVVETEVVVSAPVITETVEVIAEPLIKLSFDCVVAGTPVAFPNDLFISNPYEFILEEGVEVAYLAGEESGIVILPEIEPGEGVYVQSALEDGLEAGTACSAVEQ